MQAGRVWQGARLVRWLVLACLLVASGVFAQTPASASAWQMAPATAAVARQAVSEAAPWPHTLQLPQARNALLLSRLSEPWLLRGEESPRSMLAVLDSFVHVSQAPQGIELALWQRGVWRAQALIAARSGLVRRMQQALESLRQLDPQQRDPLVRADQALILALHEDLQGRSHEASEYALAAQKDFNQACQSAATVVACDPRIWWRCLYLLAGLAAEAGEHVQALQWAQQAQRLAHGIGDIRLMVSSLLAQAQAHAALREHEQARQRMQQAQSMLNAVPEEEMGLTQLMLVLASIHQEDEQITQEAHGSQGRDHMNRLMQALVLAQQLGLQRRESQIQLLLGQHWLKHQPAKALQMTWRALAVARQHHDQRLHASLLHMAGLARLALGQSRLARAHLAEAQQMWLLMASPAARARALAEHSRMLEHLGDMAGALRVHLQERELRQEIEQKNREALLTQLRQHHEVKARQAELVRLEREQRILESQLENETLKTRVAALTAAALLLAVVLVLLLVLRMRDINRRLRQDEILLRIQSERDALTGLANRQHVNGMLVAQNRLSLFQGGVMLLDVDHFKQINDQHGHANGDLVLVEVARRLVGALRSGGDDLASRWGGEEFLVLTRWLSPDEMQALALRLMHAVSDTPIALPGGPPDGAKPLHVGLSVGYATFPLPGAGKVDWSRALRLVDLALYAAKAGGRGRAVGIQRLRPPSDREFGEAATAVGRTGSTGRTGGVSKAAEGADAMLATLAALEQPFDPQQLASWAELRVLPLQPAPVPVSGGAPVG